MDANVNTEAAGGQRPEPGPRESWAVEPGRVTVYEDAFGRLCVTVDGETHEDVRPRRLFPVSGKSDCVSFMADRHTEVLLLAHPHRLDRESRKALDRALAKVYYGAVITRVDRIAETMGVSMWQVMTNRGYAKFEVVDRHRHIRILDGGRYLITDADGNRFEIEDIRQLDRQSQAFVATET